MKSLLKSLAVLTLSSVSGLSLTNFSFQNAKVVKTLNINNKSNLKANNTPFKRYDSLNLVNSDALNTANQKAIKTIQNTKNISNKTFNGQTYQDALLQIFNNKLFLKNNNKYENLLSNNQNSSSLGISFPMNYNGVYFPWWGFGDYFYWYISSDVVKKINQLIGWGEPITATAILSVLTSCGIIGPFAASLGIMLMTLPGSWYMDNVPSYDNGNGVCVGISILPSPIIFEVASQDKYVSQIDSFTVDYKFLGADYITVCLDEQGINFLLNYYNQNRSGDGYAVNILKPYFKTLTAIDNTGWGGYIQDSDYTDMAYSLINNDHFYQNNVLHSYLKDFVYYHPNFKSIDIRTQREYATTDAWDPYDPMHIHYSTDWEIWKNS